MAGSDKTSFKLTCLGGLAVVTVVVAVLLFFGPSPIEPTPPGARSAPVPEAENAWRLYERAAARVKASGVPGDLGEADGSALEAQQAADLARLEPAFADLREGARRPRSQAFATPPTVLDPLPPYTDLTRLGKLAAVRARQLEAGGQADRAVDLLLATHEMGTDLLEPDAPLITAAVSTAVRRSSTRALLGVLARGRESAEADRRILEEIGAQDRRYPDLAQALEWENAGIERGLHAMFVTGAAAAPPQGGAEDWVQRLPGLRLRMYNGLVRSNRAGLPALVAATKSWDRAGMEQAASDIVSGASARGVPWSERVLSAPLRALVVPNYAALLDHRYEDATGEAALLALASLQLYEREHGRYPSDLAAAGIQAVDPATGKPPGYRLEGGEPVLWFTGLDKADDGGRPGPDGTKANQPGYDVVYDVRALKKGRP